MSPDDVTPAHPTPHPKIAIDLLQHSHKILNQQAKGAFRTSFCFTSEKPEICFNSWKLGRINIVLVRFGAAAAAAAAAGTDI